MLLLPEGQTGEALEPSTKSRTEIGERWLTQFVFFKGEKYVTLYNGLPIVLLTLLYYQH